MTLWKSHILFNGSEQNKSLGDKSCKFDVFLLHIFIFLTSLWDLILSLWKLMQRFNVFYYWRQRGNICRIPFSLNTSILWRNSYAVSNTTKEISDGSAPWTNRSSGILFVAKHWNSRLLFAFRFIHIDPNLSPVNMFSNTSKRAFCVMRSNHADFWWHCWSEAILHKVYRMF